jgi:hypothetical protein
VPVRIAPFLVRRKGLARWSHRFGSNCPTHPEPSHRVARAKTGLALVSASGALDRILGSRFGDRLPLNIAHFVRAAAGAGGITSSTW